MEESKIRRVTILGVGIDQVSLKQSVQIVEDWLRSTSPKKHYIVTTNPEFIMAAQKDGQFRKILNGADLAVPDGVALRLSGKVTDIVGGIYLMEGLCRVAAERGFTTAFLGGRKKVAKEAAECLQKKYPGLKVVFANDGPEVDLAGREIVRGDGEENSRRTGAATERSEDARRDTEPARFAGASARRAGPRTMPPVDILFVGFGQVKQEKWITNNLEKLPIRVAMGVGGSFDEIAGRVVQVPGWVHQLGLKWLIRLIWQPSRFKRQLAIWQFAWMMMKGWRFGRGNMLK